MLQNECEQKFVSHTEHANGKRDRAQKRREKKRIADKQKRDEAKKLETKKDSLHIRTLKTKERIISRDNVSITNAQTPQICDNAIELFTNRQETSGKSDELQNECGQKFVSHTEHANRKRDRAQKRREKKRIADKQKRDKAKKLDREKNYLHVKYSGTKNRYTSRYNVSHAIEQRQKKCEQSSQMANLRRKRKLLEKMKRYRSKQSKRLADCVNIFNEKTSHGPIYVCTMCLQTWFRVSVSNVSNISWASDIQRATYLECTQNYKSVDGKEWLCNTCKAALKKGHWPKLSVANGLGFPDIPDALKLNGMEERVISPRLLFFQMQSHFLGRCTCVIGHVVNLSVDVVPTVKMLPRTLSDTQTITVRYK